MDSLHDDFVDDAFHSTLSLLKADVEREVGVGKAVYVIATWAGRRPSTIYNWLERTSTPSCYQDLVRLAIGSGRAGYCHFAKWMFPTLSVVQTRESITNLRLDEERKRNQTAWGIINQAEDSGDFDTIIEQANVLVEIGEDVREEGKRMKSELSATTLRKVAEAPVPYRANSL